MPEVVPPEITPEQADDLLRRYKAGVQEGQIPLIDLQVVRQQVEDRLAEQEVETLADLESRVPHAVGGRDLPDGIKDEEPVGYLTLEQEAEYIARENAKLGDPHGNPRSRGRDAVAQEEKHWAELTPRELERQAELLNPQSTHNWLRTHTKVHAPALPEDGDNDSHASQHENNIKSAPIVRAEAKRTTDPGGKHFVARKHPRPSTLAKQVGDRSVESAKAKESWSPGAASGGFDEDELGFDDGGVAAFGTASGKKKGRDPDQTYRVKGGGSSSKGKRKRSTTGGEQGGVGAGGEEGVKRMKVVGPEDGKL